MNTSNMPAATINAGDIYTDVNSLAKLKSQKNSPEALAKVSKQFESMFIGMMLKSMRQANAVFEQDGLFESKDSLFYRDMYDQQLSIELSNGRGIGIAKALERQLAGVNKKSTAQINQTDTAAQEIQGTEKIAGKEPSEVKNADWRRVVTTQIPKTINKDAVPQRFEEPLAQSDWLDPYLNVAQVAPNKPVDVNIQLNIDGPQDFIDQLLPYARAAAASLGVNPLALIAQAAMETGWGKRMVSDGAGNSSNNLFNIKANSAWAGNSIEVSTLEYKNGTPRKELAQFRQYESIAQSFNDYVNLLKNSPRYQSALAVAGDAKQFLKELHGAGYATDPLYSQKIISLFEVIADGRYKKDE